jgi:hypothetical protein
LRVSQGWNEEYENVVVSDQNLAQNGQESLCMFATVMLPPFGGHHTARSQGSTFEEPHTIKVKRIRIQMTKPFGHLNPSINSKLRRAVLCGW